MAVLSQIPPTIQAPLVLITKNVIHCRSFKSSWYVFLPFLFGMFQSSGNCSLPKLMMVTEMAIIYSMSQRWIWTAYISELLFHQCICLCSVYILQDIFTTIFNGKFACVRTQEMTWAYAQYLQNPIQNSERECILLLLQLILWQAWYWHKRTSSVSINSPYCYLKISIATSSLWQVVELC